MTWKVADINARIDEYKKIRPDPGRTELTLLETALFIEDVFDIRLSDDDISYAAIGTYDSVKRLVNRKLGIE